MKSLRIRVLLLVLWLVVFFGSQLAFEPIGLHRITCLFVGGAVILLLVVPWWNRFPGWLVGLASGLALVTVKAMLGELLNGTPMVYLITEVSFVAVSTILAQWVGQSIHEFETEVVKISVGNHTNSQDRVHYGREILYREVRRARNHQRPLTLLSIDVDPKSINFELSKIMEEAQSALKKQVVLSSISQILCGRLEDCDIVVQDHNRFLAVLPEITPDDLPILVARLQQQAADQAGVKLQIGTASLPNDGFTLEGLIEKASDNMNGNHSDLIYPETEDQRVKQLVH